jgi:hypothetical protein
MLRKVMLLAAMLAMALVAAAPALAVSPHFVSADATLNPNGTLTVAFKEAGLGTNQLINYELSADATATYVCVNKGGQQPERVKQDDPLWSGERVGYVPLGQERECHRVADCQPTGG